jgi:hypothetical protein
MSAELGAWIGVGLFVILIALPFIGTAIYLWKKWRDRRRQDS